MRTWARGCMATMVPAVVFGFGCTTKLSSTRIDASVKTAPPGVVYFLPQGELQVGLTREITRCECSYPDPSDKAKRIACDIQKPSKDWQFDVEVALVPTLETKYIADSANAYYIDYEDLTKWMKTTVINVNLYENGTLRGVNSELTDKTRQVLRDTLKGAISIAKMAMGVPSISAGTVGPGAAVREVPPAAHICTAGVLAALSNKVGLETDIAARTKKIGDLEFDLAYNVQHGKKTDQELNKIRADIAEQRTNLAAITDRLDKEKGKLTEVSVDSAIPAETSLDFRLPPPPTIIEKWFDQKATSFWARHSPTGDFVEINGKWIPAVWSPMLR